MNRIYAMLYVLCLSIVAMGCPTVVRDGALKPAKNTEREEGYVEFKPKKPKIEASPHCSEQGPNQQDPKQVKNPPIPEGEVIEEEGPKKETTSADVTATKISNAGSNTGTASPTGSSPTRKKDTVPSIEHPVPIELSRLSNGIPLQDRQAIQEQQAETQVEKAVKEVEDIAVGFDKMVKENIKTLTEEVNRSSGKKRSKEILQNYEKMYNDGLEVPQKKIELAQALVEIYPNDTKTKSFQDRLDNASATFPRVKTKFDNTVHNFRKRLGIGK